MLRSKVSPLYLALITTLGTLLPNFGSAGEFDRSRFLNDPYLPFSTYTSRASLLSDFHEYFAYKIVEDKKLEEQAQAWVDQAYLAFKALYPRFMANKDKPAFVIIESENATDIHAYFPEKYEHNHKGLMIFTTSFIASDWSEAKKLGLVSHEMSHLLFWHLDAKVNPINISYADKTPLSLVEAENFKKWISLADIMGWANQKEMNGVTFRSQMGGGMQLLISNLVKSDKPKCGKELENGLGVLTERLEIIDGFYWDSVLTTAEEKSQRDKETRHLLQMIRSCLQEQSSQTNSVKVNQNATNVLRSVDIEVPDDGLSFDGLIDLTKRAQAKLRELAEGFAIQKLRYYSSEDQADEAAITVIKSLGHNGSDFPDIFFTQLDEKSKKLCERAIEDDIEPPFGNLLDSHHAPCWRIYNLRKFIRSDRKRLIGLE